MTNPAATAAHDGARMVYVTCASTDEAAHIARTVVGERLAACANIIPGVRSFYWWDGGVQDDAEVVLILKSVARQVAPLTARIKSLHSYDVPCIVAYAVAGGHAPYLEWVEAETAERFD